MPVLALAVPSAAATTAPLRAAHARLRASADTLARVAGRPDLDDIFAADAAVRAAAALNADLARHVAFVEGVVAPRLLGAFPDTGALLDALAREHRAAEACVAALAPTVPALGGGRRAPMVAFAAAVGFVLDALRPMLAREEGALLPLVAALPDDDRRALAGPGAPPA